MSTLSLNLRYRPLRIGWCVEAGDIDAVRRAMQLSFTQWGGRFNPIIPLDDLEHAEALIKLYRVDTLFAASDTDNARDFVASHHHLPWPLFHDDIFVHNTDYSYNQLVDLHHPIAKLYEKEFHNNPNPGLQVHLYEWDQADPLADVFLATFGAPPAPADITVDYLGLTRQQLLAQRNIIAPDGPLPQFNRSAMSFASLNRVYVERHYVVQNHWDNPGFYVGLADSFIDLVNFWNLRAADIAVVFYDERYAERASRFRDDWNLVSRQISNVGYHNGAVTLWHRHDLPIQNEAVFGENIVMSEVNGPLWNGLNLRVPMMHFGEGSALAALDEQSARKTASFALTEPIFRKHFILDRQHYVLSVDPGIGLFGNERSTFNLPFIPALNVFYGRYGNSLWNAARAEPDSIGIVVSTSEDHISLGAIDTSALIAEILKSVGMAAELSDAGKVVSTLIQQMGGIQGCRAFKIEGVRTLIEKHRPDQTFSRSAAMQTILGQNDVRPLSEYQDLYIEPRPPGVALTPDSVLKHLLDKDIFRAGLNFTCPNCTLTFWTSVDEAKSHLNCDYCGHNFRTAAQLRDKDWAFRRSGLFGRGDNQGGGIPVALTLQQLLRLGSIRHSIYVAGMTLRSIGAAIPDCETDFVVVSESGRDHRIEVIIGECKTRHSITEADVRNLTAVADAFPTDLFQVYICFSRLTPFSPEEIELIRPINENGRLRVIMLTERELEPYFVYERTSQQFYIEQNVATYESMAQATDRVFFRNMMRPAAAAIQ